METKKLIKIQTILLLAILITLGSTLLVSAAIGVSSPYWKLGADQPNPMHIEEGKTEIVNFNLQNKLGDNDAIIQVTITKGAEIASLTEDTFTVPARSTDVMAPLIISVPPASAGAVYTVKLEFRDISSVEGQGVTYKTGMDNEFDVIVVSPPPPPTPTPAPEPTTKSFSTSSITLIIIAVIIILIILLLLLSKRKTSV